LVGRGFHRGGAEFTEQSLSAFRDSKLKDLTLSLTSALGRFTQGLQQSYTQYCITTVGAKRSAIYFTDVTKLFCHHQ